MNQVYKRAFKETTENLDLLLKRPISLNVVAMGLDPELILDEIDEEEWDSPKQKLYVKACKELKSLIRVTDGSTAAPIKLDGKFKNMIIATPFEDTGGENLIIFYNDPKILKMIDFDN